MADRANGGIDKQWQVRTIEAEKNEINDDVLERSVVGEVKAMYFLTKLPFFVKNKESVTLK